MSPVRWVAGIAVVVTWLVAVVFGTQLMAMAPLPRTLLVTGVFAVLATLTVLGHFYGPPPPPTAKR